MKRIRRDIALLLVLAAVFTFLGVYDTDDMAFVWRLVFWTVIMFAGYLLLTLVEGLIIERAMPKAPLLAKMAVMSLLIAIPITIGLMGLNTKLNWGVPLSAWALQFFGSFVISSLAVATTMAVRRFFEREADPEPASTFSAFMDLLPMEFRSAELWGLSSEGHYLRVHTDRGETLILHRLSDAIRELSGVDGKQTHRSWWVAKDGIDKAGGKGERRTLVLKSGVEAPVARSRIKDVKEDGWLR